MSEKTSDPETMRIFFEEITRLHENAHTSNIVVIAAGLENVLETIIRSNMPNLSNTLAEDLFRGYGPFASFRAKIDSAYAMGDIDQSLRTELHAIRDIRNKFAHPKAPKPVKFSDMELDKPFSKFPDFTPEYEQKFGRQQFLVAKFKDLLARLQSRREAALVTTALRERALKQKLSPEKSY
jgi:hypothetical protein